MACARVDQRGDQGDGGGAAADDDDLLALVIEVLRPMLRMHDGAAEILAAGELGGVALVVVVVAGESRAGTSSGSGLRSPPRSTVQLPPVVRVRPVRGDHLVAEAHVLVDAVLGGRFLEIVQDRRAVDDRLLRRPRLEPEPERVHVGVRADTGVFEQVPGAAEVVAALQDQVALRRAAVLQMPGGADAGDAGSDDDDVDKFGHAVKLSTRC